MAAPLFSSSWYRVADIKPQLRSHARLVRHVYRDQLWYVLQDLASGRFLRFNPAAYRLMALMDGIRTLNEIWQLACQLLGDEVPSQDEVLHLLAQLHQANLLLTDRRPDLEELKERSLHSRRMKLKQYLGNPMSLKLPLFDPDRLLERCAGMVPRNWAGAFLALWLMLVLSGLVVAALHWQSLTEDLTAKVFTSENMLALALVFPFLKLIHEFGHGLAIKLLGGNCHELGLMFLVLVPVPYVDASSSVAMPSKYHRMLVGLAGMMSELSVAALAIMAWSMVNEGVLKALLHQTVILAGLTTLIFNANPLLLFDGYYVLADWLEIPNLGQKANRYLGFLINRHLFGVTTVTPPDLTRREAPWLLGYAVGAFVYRVLVTLGIVVLIANEFFFFGVILGIWSFYTMIPQPLFKHLRYLANSPTLDEHRQRAWLVTGIPLLLLALFIFKVPVASWTQSEGVIWMPQQSQVRAAQDCFGQKLLVRPGSFVEQGQALALCGDPQLEARHAELLARSNELQSRLNLASTQDQVQAQIVRSELAHHQETLYDLEKRRAKMQVPSPHAGRFVMPAPNDFPGLFLERGKTFGYVLDPALFTLLTVVPQGSADQVRNHTVKVELRSVDRIDDLLSARISRAIPAATRELPSLALSLQGGGGIGLDPRADAKSGPKALNALFQFELQFTGSTRPQTLGSRVFIRFVHDPEPLAEQWYRLIRQEFLRRFSV